MNPSTTMTIPAFRVSVPATTANLGAGYDCLGLALTLRNDLEVRPSDRVEIQVEGEGRDTLPRDETNLVWRTFASVFEKIGRSAPNVRLLCRNRVPLARGLGSSATVRVSALVAANRVAGSPLCRNEILQMAAADEGHSDNVAPALCGGLVVCGISGEEAVIERVEPAEGVRAVVMIPEMTLKTEAARSVLPETVSHSDAVANLQNTSLTAMAFVTGRFELLTSSLDDRLHQPYRKHLIPGFDEALEAARKAGAFGASLSGAGPTLIAFADKNEAAIAMAMETAFAAAGGGPSRTEVLDVDREGARIENLEGDE